MLSLDAAGAGIAEHTAAGSDQDGKTQGTGMLPSAAVVVNLAERSSIVSAEVPRLAALRY